MNAKQAAQKWNVSLSTVYRYLRDGLVTNAKKNENGHWIIDDEALRPYIIRSIKPLNEEAIYKHILNALNLRQSISQAQVSDLDNCFFVLNETGQIIKLKRVNHPDLFTQYKITPKGLSTLKSDTKLIEIVRLGMDLLKFF